ncbi:hypothetical protein M3690_04330 [Priestia megaterium]|uniref:hypothetical protein n=1 Tax=Priestia megaterium TaxID=1404 RepID=UPI00203FCF57|nr:hypothetical protein [Priestia megaterium]MCM3792519.1 hypothetical protein [Priestia megaterium]
MSKINLKEIAKWAGIIAMILKLIAEGMGDKEASSKAAEKFGVDPSEAFRIFKNRKAG